MKSFNVTREFYKPLIKVGVLLIALYILNAILKRLPMLEELSLPNIPFSGPQMLWMVISVLIIGILVNFIREFGRQLKTAVPQFPESSIVSASLVYIISIVITYDAFIPLGRILDEDIWVYQIGFLALSIVPMYIGGLTLYRNFDKIIDLFAKSDVQNNTKVVTCHKCGMSNSKASKFCIGCGSDLVVLKKTASLSCSKCNAENNPGSKFCFECGSELVDEKVEDISCLKCGTKTKHDAKFCSSCGTGFSYSTD